MNSKTIVIAAAMLVCLAACGARDEETATTESAVPPLSEPTLDGSAPVTIAPGADAPYPVTPDASQPPPIVTPEQNSAPPSTP